VSFLAYTTNTYWRTNVWHTVSTNLAQKQEREAEANIQKTKKYAIADQRVVVLSSKKFLPSHNLFV